MILRNFPKLVLGSLLFPSSNLYLSVSDSISINSCKINMVNMYFVDFNVKHLWEKKTNFNLKLFFFSFSSSASKENVNQRNTIEHLTIVPIYSSTELYLPSPSNATLDK